MLLTVLCKQENSLLKIKKRPLIPLQCDDHLIFSLSIFGTKLVPETSFGNLAKPTFSAFKTVDGFKFPINQLQFQFQLISSYNLIIKIYSNTKVVH